MRGAVGKPAVIVPGPYGRWMIGHRTRFGIQTAIDNFSSVAEARVFCAGHRAHSEVVVEGVRLDHRQCALLHFVASTRRATVQEAATTAGSSVAATRKAAVALERGGLLVFGEAVGARRGLAVMEATERGATLGALMGPPVEAGGAP